MAITVGHGRDSWGSVVEEATYGSSPGTGESYFEIISESLKQEIEVKSRRSLRGVSDRKTTLGNKVVGGDLVLDLNFEGMGLFLKHAMGGYSFSADTPVAGANTHIFTLLDALPMGLSVEVSKGDIPTGDVFLYQGCKVDTLDFDLTSDEIIQLTCGLIAQTETADGAASATPSYPTDLPVEWRYSGTLTLAGTAAIEFEEAKISLANNLRRRFLMHDTTREPDRGTEKRKVTGEATVEFEDLTLYNKYIAGTPGTLALTYTSTSFVTGTTPYTIAFSMPNIQLTGLSPIVGGEGPITVAWPFLSMHDGTSTDALTITIVSGEATLPLEA